MYLDCKAFFEASDPARRGALDTRKIALYSLGRRICFRGIKEVKVEVQPELYGTSYCALFNEEQDCPEGPHLSNGVRSERHASTHGMFRGVKPADNVLTFVAETNQRATPVTHADERNLCPKRRKYHEVKWLTHLTQKGNDGCSIG